VARPSATGRLHSTTVNRLPPDADKAAVRHRNSDSRDNPVRANAPTRPKYTTHDTLQPEAGTAQRMRGNAVRLVPVARVTARAVDGRAGVA
jgi:hypothetical protein